MSTTAQEKSLTMMVPTINVFPNTLNPRKNDSISQEEITSIIRKHGWEEPLTAYRKEEGSDLFVLLAGHRRLFAAKEAGIEEVPVYIVKKPETVIEEIERIGSLQSGRVNWSAYEWASYTYNLWIEWGKPAKNKFAKDISLSANAVTDYIAVMQYYPRTEIEEGLTKKELTVTGLAALAKWIKALDKFKPNLVQNLGEDMIRRIMIDKFANKKVSRDTLRNTDYCRQATQDDIKKFLTDKNMELEAQIGYLGLQQKYKDFNGHMISFGHMRNRIPEIKPETKHQQESAIETLEVTIKALQEKLNEIKAL